MKRHGTAINETSNKKKRTGAGGGTIEFRDNKKGCSQDNGVWRAPELHNDLLYHFYI